MAHLIPRVPSPTVAGYAIAAPGANADILASALTPKQAGWFAGHIVLAVGSIVNYTVSDGSTLYTVGLNSSTAVAAGDSLPFAFPVHPARSYNFQVETDGIIRELVVYETDTPPSSGSGSSGGGTTGGIVTGTTTYRNADVNETDQTVTDAGCSGCILEAINTTAAEIYLHFKDVGSGGYTPGTTAADLILIVPPTVNGVSGARSTYLGHEFTNGIHLHASTGIDTAVDPNGLDVSLSYRPT